MWNDNGMDRSAAELSSAIGAQVTRLRAARDWSLSGLAARAGIGKGTLSEIEAGTRNPTLETLYSIAGALGVPLAHLIARPPAGQPAMSPNDQPSPPTDPVVHGGALSATLLESFNDPGMSTELYRLLIRAGQPQVSPGHGPGVMEYLTVTAGTLLAGPAGKQVRISAGEHASWESAGEHSYEALTPDGAEAILLIRHPL